MTANTTDTKKIEVIEKLRGGLIVSCQTQPGDPIHEEGRTVVTMAKAAVWGGAKGIRANGPDQIKAIREVTDLPIIGLWKIKYPDVDTHIITPTVEHAKVLVEAGAVFADCATYDEAARCVELGADIVSPTKFGYTPDTKMLEPPNWRDFARMCRDFKDKAYVIMEGHIYTPEDAMKALFLGAHAVVVGSAITRPHYITKRFTDLMGGLRPEDNWRDRERAWTGIITQRDDTAKKD